MYYGCRVPCIILAMLTTIYDNINSLHSSFKGTSPMTSLPKMIYEPIYIHVQILLIGKEDAKLQIKFSIGI